jgi:DNA-binding response OmpR family regulator
MAKHILIVDDTQDLRNNIRDLLEMEGYRVSHAANGKIALKALQRVTPDLIISDLLMPEMNGFDFIVHVRNNSRWNDVTILVYSAMPVHESEKKALDLGANFYLKKPSTIEVLVDTVTRLIK